MGKLMKVIIIIMHVFSDTGDHASPLPARDAARLHAAQGPVGRGGHDGDPAHRVPR